MQRHVWLITLCVTVTPSGTQGTVHTQYWLIILCFIVVTPLGMRGDTFMQRQLVVMTLGVVGITLFLATRVFNGICGIRQCVCCKHRSFCTQGAKANVV